MEPFSGIMTASIIQYEFQTQVTAQKHRRQHYVIQYLKKEPLKGRISWNPAFLLIHELIKKPGANQNRLAPGLQYYSLILTSVIWPLHTSIPNQPDTIRFHFNSSVRIHTRNNCLPHRGMHRPCRSRPSCSPACTGPCQSPAHHSGSRIRHLH